MSRNQMQVALSFAFMCLVAPAARPASLSVVPITVDVPEPAAIGTLTLRNREPRPLNAQVRVFRWTQVAGVDKLEPTDNVVVSPPIVTIEAGADYVIRFQRTAEAEVAGEEAYRVVVDELPNPNRQRNGTIAIVLRYLVPAFFLSPDATQPKLTWSLDRRGSSTVLTATNKGDRRIQILDLKLGAKAAHDTMVARGLAGYVLGRSSRSWVVPRESGSTNDKFVTADSDHGPIHVLLSH